MGSGNVGSVSYCSKFSLVGSVALAVSSTAEEVFFVFLLALLSSSSTQAVSSDASISIAKISDRILRSLPFLIRNTSRFCFCKISIKHIGLNGKGIYWGGAEALPYGVGQRSGNFVLQNSVVLVEWRK